jgi:hypothetical protein
MIRMDKARVAKNISVSQKMEENCGDPDLDGGEMERILY